MALEFNFIIIITTRKQPIIHPSIFFALMNFPKKKHEIGFGKGKKPILMQLRQGEGKKIIFMIIFIDDYSCGSNKKPPLQILRLMSVRLIKF
jgi:hypothetical protein